MTRINSAVLQQFSKKGFVTNEGIAVDALLFQSASHPISNEEIKIAQEKRETPEGKLDKNGKPLKYSQDMEKVYADKGYYGKVNRIFLTMNHVADGIMRKNTKSTKLTDTEIERNKQLSKKRYIVEQYFGVSHLHYGAFRARFPGMIKNALDNLFRQMAFNLFRGHQILGTVKI